MCKYIYVYLAFQCIAKGQPMNIPEYITYRYVKNAEEVVNTCPVTTLRHFLP